MREPREPARPRTPGVTDDLASRIASAKRGHMAEAAQQEAAGAKDMTGLARGMRIGTEFIAAVLVGAVLGFAIDHFFGTGPWGMLVLLLLGFAAGIMNVIRVVTEMNAKSPPPPGSDLGPEAEDGDDA